MAELKYITQIKAVDLDKMLAAGRMQQGRGIIIKRNGDSYKIEIDTDVIIDLIWCFVRQGMVREGLSGAPCVVPYTAKDTRNHVMTDPNQFA